jgi:hypothetical protein
MKANLNLRPLSRLYDPKEECIVPPRTGLALDESKVGNAESGSHQHCKNDRAPSAYRQNTESLISSKLIRKLMRKLES